MISQKSVRNLDDLILALENERDQILTQYGSLVANACTSDFPKMIHHEVFATGRLNGIETALDMVRTAVMVLDSQRKIHKLESIIEDLEKQIDEMERLVGTK